MILRLRHIVLLILLILGMQSLAQIDLKTRVDNTEILIGDQFLFYIKADIPESVQVQSFDLSSLDTVDYIEIISEGVLSRTTENGVTKLEQELILTIFDTGYLYIPEIKIAYRSGSINSTKSSPALPMHVSAVVVNPEGLAPIKNIAHERMNMEDIYPFILALLLIAILVYFIMKRRQAQNKVQELIPAEPERSPYEIARSELDLLLREELWIQRKEKEHQTRTTYALRAFIERQFRILALESTSPEIISQLALASLDQEHLHRVRQILERADLVKFAKAKPSTKEHKDSVLHAIGFVDHYQDHVRLADGRIGIPPVVSSEEEE